MTTNADIIRRAHRLMGTVGAGQEPTGVDAADTMERLQSLILGLPGLVLNARWTEVATSSAYTAEEGDRITVTSPGAVTLPTTITPAFADARPPLDFARVQIIGGANAGLWVWIATKGQWVQLDALAISDDFPFGAEDVDGVAAMLAVEMAPEYGEAATLQQRTIAKAQAQNAAFRARLKRSAPTDYTRPLGDDEYAVRGFTDYA